MEKTCINCKWYYKYKCNCKDNNISITIENNMQDKIINYIEDGILWENIRENLNIKELTSIFNNVYNEAGALKKNINNKKIDSEVEDNENNLIELIDECISSSLLRYFENVDSNKVNVKINNPNEYYCKYYI